MEGLVLLIGRKELTICPNSDMLTHSKRLAFVSVDECFIFERL